MPDRMAVMREAEEKLRTAEAARAPAPIVSAQYAGFLLIAAGLSFLVLAFATDEVTMVIPIRFSGYMIGIGAALFFLGRAGGARYRVTQFSRYPQQTGELADMYMQTLGDAYTWIVVAMLIVWVVLMAL